MPNRDCLTNQLIGVLMDNLILDSHSAKQLLADYAGGKAKNMAMMENHDIKVPQWCCLSSKVFDLFVQQHKIENEITELVSSDNYNEKSIEELFLNHSMHEDITSLIIKELTKRELFDEYLAIRSSGLDEDSADNSFAGQFSSYLFQKGIENIEKSIKLCWASAYSNRAIAYRKEKGLPTTGLKVGVVIQRMINTDKSGVAFTRNVINPTDRDNLLISATYGLCEGVVSGEINCDEYIVNRQSFEYKSTINNKDKKLIPNWEQGGTKQHTNPITQQEISSLNEEEIKNLTILLLKIETFQGFPQDCEWGIENNEIYLLQSRPITSLPSDDFFNESINGEQFNLWDNSNIIESYSGVTTPLTFSFASFAYRQVYIQFHQIMGVPQDIINQQESMYRNMLGLVRGRIYYNLINWYKLVLLLPGAANNGSFMETMMGVKQGLTPEVAKLFEFMENPPKYSLFLKLRVTLSTVWRFIRINSIIKKFKDNFYLVYDKAMNTDFKSKSLTELGDYYNFLEQEVLKKWQAPIINDYLCMIFFGLLKKLTENWIESEDGASLQNDLLCGQGDLESMEPTKWLMKTAKEIDLNNPHMKKILLDGKLEELKTNKEVLELLSPFLYNYGFRCADELKLESFDLHDDPSFAINALQSYIKMKTYDIKKMEENEKKILEAAERIVFSELTGYKATIYKWVLKQTRKAVANREDLRFLRTKIFGVCRQVFRAKESHFIRLGLIENIGDLFYLTTEEIMSYIEGRALASSFKTLINTRKKEFDNYKKTLQPPERFLSKGACSLYFNFPQVLSASDLLAGSRRISDDPNTLLGTSCCPGEVEGIVRVIYKIEDAQDLDGQILVTERTDPGWVPLYPSCSGILIERGSLLSHSAVVARELGIPTIVGVDGGLVEKLHSGDRVKVNATLGEIKIIERAEEE